MMQLRLLRRAPASPNGSSPRGNPDLVRQTPARIQKRDVGALYQRFSTRASPTTRTVRVMQSSSCAFGVGVATAELKGTIPLEFGGELTNLRVHWEEWGDKSAPVVMVFPALSSDSHVTCSVADPIAGWWQEVVGPGLGSPFGSTSALSTNPTTGQIWGPDFPAITPGDQARLHKMLLDHLGITKVHAVVGSSLGGMKVLKFAQQYPDVPELVISIASTGKTTPGTVALRQVQRRAIMADPRFNGGRYHPGPGPIDGLRVARELGTITYRSRDEFNERFDWKPFGPYQAQNMCFEVETYLNAQGLKFAHNYDANCYLTMSRCMDLMDLGIGYANYAEGVNQIKAKTYIIGVDRDMLIPLAEQEHLAKLLKALGKDVKFEVMSSLFGHDAFLKEPEWLNPRLHKFLVR